MDKLKLAQWGERLKSSGAQMSRMVSGKMKEILQTPTPESKMVDEATLETLEEPNWGMNMRICSMINSQEFNGTEIVRAIKKKITGKSVITQGLGLDLLEACALNCEKVFSEVASEKVLEDMVLLIENEQTDREIRDRAWQLIRAWGQSEDLAYLPIFRQTYMSLQNRIVSPQAADRNSPSLESYIHQESQFPPENYPLPEPGLPHTMFSRNYHSLSVEEKKETLVETRNTIDLLSSILSTETEPKPIKEELTVTMLEKCKESQPIIQSIIESTTDDEAILFEALSLHEELQQIISRYVELEADMLRKLQSHENSEAAMSSLRLEVGTLTIDKNMPSDSPVKQLLQKADTDKSNFELGIEDELEEEEEEQEEAESLDEKKGESSKDKKKV